MGIVLKQTFINTIITYLGFAMGAVNALFLYTNFLTDEYYGLVGVVLSTSAILMPLMAFGVQNTLVKYYSSFEKKDAFLTLMVLLPLAVILPLALFSYVSNSAIADFLAKKNTIVKDYVWYIFLIGLAMAYFEVFYAWARVHLKSVFGNFMKEVFVRLGITVLLFAVHFEFISIDAFMKALVGLYLLRMLIMKIYAYGLKRPRLNFNFPKNTREIVVYSALIILGGSAAVILLEVDKFMINQYIEIENVAYYAVAVHIATVIIAPSRAMHQITYPMTAELLNANNLVGLKGLYQKSSLTLFIVAGLVFLMVILNLNDLYQMIPAQYRGGFLVVLLIGLVKLYDSFLGCNNAILFNSEYYRATLWLGVFLAAMTILFNMWLIPKYGMEGAAMASFLAVFIYNTSKLAYVKLKFNMWPFTKETFKVIGLILLVGTLFYTFQFPFHPLVNILLKLVLMTAMYVGILYRFKISEDVFGVLKKFLNRKK
ncbi:oligosaccharide flippase family protein [Aurantibacter crassamenti]|uniref:oligosaccharide flippase family protein n=1 Tax=Aurantibacter crassamenti TaxID=1837375 RepID=UPI0019392CEA|nr:oligosaccharide flippase family protein [Aurantibacter crassamenti]MBM1107383.1 oligosaccharide flippase family protein [Aurantibacter crassamenti]